MIPYTIFGFRLLVYYDCMQRFNYCKIQVPSTIPQLYAAMLESEKRIITFCTNEFANIRKQMKVRYEVILPLYYYLYIIV